MLAGNKIVLFKPGIDGEYSKSEATFTHKVSKGRAAFRPVIKVGSEERYEPRCRGRFVPKGRKALAHPN